MKSEERRIYVMDEAYHSRTVVSVPRPPTRSEGIHSPLRRGGDGGGAVGLRAPSSNKKRGYLLPSPTGRGWRGCWVLEDGAQRPHPTMISLAHHMNSSLNHAIVLLLARLFTPLSDGEGMGVGLFLWLLEDGAQRPPSYYGLPRTSHEIFPLHSSLFILPSSFFPLHSSLFILHSSFFTLHSSLFTLHSLLFT